jgi:hypothetical protein
VSRHVLHTLLALMVSVLSLATTPVRDEAAAGDAAASKTERQSRMALHMVETTSMSEAELANQPHGQSQPGAGEPGAGETGQQPASPGPPVPPLGWTAYVDPTYGFSIDYPKGFVIQPQDVSKFAQFSPTPVASMFFMNPSMAAGALAGIEPPDLDVRVYHAGSVDSLERWLESVGLTSVDSGAVVQPYRNASVSGLKVCQSTMMAPGCSVYVLHSGRVYQLAPISREGEAMMETFALLP